MTLTSIILLILLGLFLLMLEILFVPGMVLGFISVILMIVGIIFAYRSDAATGHIVLASTAVTTISTVYWAFKSNVWKKLQVNSSMEGKANVLEENTVKTGDEGRTISRLNPMGKALLNGKILEVHGMDGFIDEGNEIIVVKVQGNKIWVRRKTREEKSNVSKE